MGRGITEDTYTDGKGKRNGVKDIEKGENGWHGKRGEKRQENERREGKESLKEGMIGRTNRQKKEGEI